jgi:hypothetical protein
MLQVFSGSPTFVPSPLFYKETLFEDYIMLLRWVGYKDTPPPLPVEGVGDEPETTRMF